jgi:4-oxalocrotonate tautomerase
MPIIRVEMFEGRTADQKRACAKALTQAWVETCNGSPDQVIVVFSDLARDDWATGGRLASDPKHG